jgi:hypothetical protein
VFGFEGLKFVHLWSYEQLRFVCFAIRKWRESFKPASGRVSTAGSEIVICGFLLPPSVMQTKFRDLSIPQNQPLKPNLRRIDRRSRQVSSGPRLFQIAQGGQVPLSISVTCWFQTEFLDVNNLSSTYFSSLSIDGWSLLIHSWNVPIDVSVGIAFKIRTTASKSSSRFETPILGAVSLHNRRGRTRSVPGQWNRVDGRRTINIWMVSDPTDTSLYNRDWRVIVVRRDWSLDGSG